MSDIEQGIKTFNEDKLILGEIINNYFEPIFYTKSDEIIYANKSFLNLVNVKNIDDLNKKFKNQDYIFKKNDKNNIVIIRKNKKEKRFALDKLFLEKFDYEIFILRDINYKEKYKKYLNELIYTDHLTNLPNRKSLLDKLQNKYVLIDAISIIDINSFKEINDFFGHKIGDFILKGVGKLIKSHIKDNEKLTLYKFPSDTYCITNHGMPNQEFENFIRDIIQIIYSKVFVYEQHEIDVRATAGISFSQRNNKLITADIALQTAKKDNKYYQVFYEDLDRIKEYENNMFWTKKVKSALIDDKIEVFFQPIINNKTLRVEKFECLVRLIDGKKVISPYFFLDISKKSNQYKQITKIVIEKSFQVFHNLPYEFSLNISYEDIENDTFLDFIRRMLKKYNVSNQVIFEILEDENIKSYDLLINFINKVKALNCKIAIDDFGSGYSNFEHILNMNIDYLKIDASIIKKIATSSNSYKITKTIINFAENLGLKTIAEFVENKEIFNLVKDLGADYSQGYFFSPPVDKNKLKKLKTKSIT